MKMKAIVRDECGTTDVLELRDVDKPEISTDEILIRVHAAGVDRGVWHIMTGLPYPIRLAGFGVRAPKNPVLGMDMAEVIESIGAGVTEFKPGDEVFGVGEGSFAEYAIGHRDKITVKPTNLTFEQASVVPTSACTALQALRKGKVQAGEHVLVIGASGGVGTYAVQLAKAFGADATGVCSTTKSDLVISIGADRVIDYKREDFADGQQHYDLIIDIGGNSSLSRLRRALTPKGRLVITGGEGGGKWLGGVDRQLRARMLSPFIAQKLRTFIAAPNAADLMVLKEVIEVGKVTPVVDRTYPLSEVPKAIDYLDEGHVRGKVAITL
jgi:NADPH:quinone reductase-like Zn-dependent oxidoreductase